MPLVHTKNIFSRGRRTIWKISESVPELMPQLPKTQDLTEFRLISNPTRQKEWLAVRILAYQTAQLFNVFPKNIIKNQWNCPKFVGNSLQISFSHTENYATVLVHPTHQMGIDMEAFSPKIKKVAPRVMTEQELMWANSSDKLAQIWCAKEAVYKLYMKGNVDFRKDIQIQEDNGKIIALLHKFDPTKRILIQTEKYMGQTIAYCMDF